MPSYDYECRDCELKITVVRGMHDKDPGYVCTACGNRMIKVYSLGAVTFKGSGFYRTDK